MIDTTVYRLLRAKPYRDFSGNLRRDPEGVLVERWGEVTLCGKNRDSCPGTIFEGVFNEVDCKGCRRSFEAAERYAQNQQKWEREIAIREAEREQSNRLWWLAYDEYLRSPTWREKRRGVLLRCDGMCEGCGDQRATQVHHKSYPQDVMPGSDEWIRLEKLFDLVALCDECHSDLHPHPDD
jgi:5-methylcytosine-specific restriction endonuclease McrA